MHAHREILALDKRRGDVARIRVAANRRADGALELRRRVPPVLAWYTHGAGNMYRLDQAGTLHDLTGDPSTDPDEPLDLPVDQPLEAELRILEDHGSSETLIADRLERLAKASGRISAPSLSIDAITREDLYEERQ